MINPDEDDRSTAGAWTAERLRRLVELWTTHASALSIAEALGGGLTRSAVVGKLARLGLSRDAAARRDARAEGARQSHAKQRTAEGRPRRPAGSPRFCPAPPSAGRPGGVAPRLVPMADLERRQCRWPYALGDETAFCGHPAQGEGPYCPAHHRRAYVAVLPPLTLEQVQARGFSPLGDLG